MQTSLKRYDNGYCPNNGKFAPLNADRQYLFMGERQYLTDEVLYDHFTAYTDVIVAIVPKVPIR